MRTTKAIAFFPWWNLELPISLGPVRLLPYVKGKAPGDQNDALQRDIDGVVSAYAIRPRHSVKRCALLELDDWRLGQDPGPILQRLFTAQEAIGFASLAARELFAGHFGYVCFDNFSLVVQRYQEGRPDTFAFNTRRRDGGAHYLWSSDEFAFHKPLHVDNSLKPPVPDSALVALLMDTSTPARWLDAVIEFNHANTDSIDIPRHVEIVMLKTAFELVLECGESAAIFQSALDELLAPLENPPKVAAGPLRDQWLSSYQKSKRPIQAWAREFCALRGMAAHKGRSMVARPFVWSEDAHLAFASILFPLVLKRIASNAGRYEMDLEDLDKLKRIDEYLMEDPMTFKADPDDEYGAAHPWREIELDIKMRAVSRRL